MEGLLGVTSEDPLISNPQVLTSFRKGELHMNHMANFSRSQRNVLVWECHYMEITAFWFPVFPALSLKDLPALIQEKHGTDIKQMNKMQMEMQLFKKKRDWKKIKKKWVVGKYV